MGDAYRVATKVPWENHVRDWSHLFSNVDGALHEVRDRARNHQGAQFDERRYGHEPFGNDRDLQATLDAARHDLEHGSKGDIIQVRAHKDDVQWWTKRLEVAPDVINRSEANYHIDYLYTWVFREHKSNYAGVENWGTCNRRFIDGTTTWSEHCPWYPGSHTGSGGCNALDIHASYDVMYRLSRDLAGHQHVAKVLFYNHEWTPGTGWISASVGHYDHVHVEGPRDHGGLAPGCNY